MTNPSTQTVCNFCNPPYSLAELSLVVSMTLLPLSCNSIVKLNLIGLVHFILVNELVSILNQQSSLSYLVKEPHCHDDYFTHV
uniref:Uncharacterized protein n=1 Tax=Rhizophora mucronata TaxID=61149 RepID=A0A2P2MZT5_RHIMU